MKHYGWKNSRLNCSLWNCECHPCCASWPCIDTAYHMTFVMIFLRRNDKLFADASIVDMRLSLPECTEPGSSWALLLTPTLSLQKGKYGATKLLTSFMVPFMGSSGDLIINVYGKLWSLKVGTSGKQPTRQCRFKRVSLIPSYKGLGRKHGNPFQCSELRNSEQRSLVRSSPWGHKESGNTLPVKVLPACSACCMHPWHVWFTWATTPCDQK